MKKVVIVGAGFAGLSAAKLLGGKKELHLTVIDRRNYHLFQPLLYQVATAGLSPAEIAVPIRSELSKFKNIHVVMGAVTTIDIKSKKVMTRDEEYSYDYLILASGAQHSYFGKDQWEDFAPGLKTLEQATEIWTSNARKGLEFFRTFEGRNLKSEWFLEARFITAQMAISSLKDFLEN